MHLAFIKCIQGIQQGINPITFHITNMRLAKYGLCPAVLVPPMQPHSLWHRAEHPLFYSHISGSATMVTEVKDEDWRKNTQARRRWGTEMEREKKRTRAEKLSHSGRGNLLKNWGEKNRLKRGRWWVRNDVTSTPERPQSDLIISLAMTASEAQGNKS